MDSVLFEVGGFAIRWYSVLILIGVILGVILAQREAKRFEIPTDFIFNLCFWAIIMGFIGARLYFVAFNYELYQDNWTDIFKVWNGGLAIHGGILFGFITVWLYCKKYGARLWRITDILVVPLLLAQAIGRWGNFFNGEAHGAVTTLAELQSNPLLPQFVIDGMKIDGLYYVPSFYYESLWCLLGVILLLIVRRLKITKVGQPTAIYIMWYSFGRFIIEAGRTDSLMFGGFKVAQIVSIALFIIALLAFMILSRKGRFEDRYNDAENAKIRF